MLKYLAFLLLAATISATTWQSKYVQLAKDGSITYNPDEKGNTIPDFSRVGYSQGNRPIPDINAVTTIAPGDNAMQAIQSAIDSLSAKPLDKNGFRGAILLRQGTYEIPGTIYIRAAGIVLRGEGMQTKLVATGTKQRPLISVVGKGNRNEENDTRVRITDRYVPTGAFSFNVLSARGYKRGDPIVVLRRCTDKWIHDIKMDQIDAREGIVQWQASEYFLTFERTITKIEGNRIFIDNPIVMALDERYGGGEIFRYTYEGRIHHVGVEDLYCESTYASDTAEDHGWQAVRFNKAENGWVRNVTARYFGYSCVDLGDAKCITVKNCRSFDAKSKITGSRRYSFNNDGQLNLFMNCETTEGRHDYVTGARTPGPNVFYNCKASNTHADIGPHHRWAAGTLYDNIVTDGEINIQDRGNWGTGHGWAGVTQILWNCTAKRAVVQSPWASGKNYCIGLQGEKYNGRLEGRPDGEWEGHNKTGLAPQSLYVAQLNARGKQLQ